MPHEMASGSQEHPSGDGHVTQRAAISCLSTNPGHALPPDLHVGGSPALIDGCAQIRLFCRHQQGRASSEQGLPQTARIDQPGASTGGHDQGSIALLILPRQNRPDERTRWPGSYRDLRRLG
jgi:hypothetical protein